MTSSEPASEHGAVAQHESPPRLFGTDGIRGAFGRPPLERSVVERVAFELTRELRTRDGEPPVVIAGGDTRESTEEIASWAAAGVRAAGGRLRWAGVLPTPGVAWLVRHLRADAGIVISASHNPFPDNGVKVLSGDGFKLEDAAERALERRVATSTYRPAAAAPTQLDPEPDLCAAYESELLGGARTGPTDRPFAALRVGLDTGNGAASAIASRLFAQLGADVHSIGDHPDGRNVNSGCGSTSPELIGALVRERGLDVGFAFDGDADRVIACDERGTVRDGDDLLYLWARHLRRSGALVPPAVVATSMSNLGLDRALRLDGVEVVRCGVGDRYVVETLRGRGLLLGGEPSGHLVHLGLATTGDGLLTALQVTAILCRSGEPTSDLLGGFERFPQVLRNVRVRAKPPLESVPGLRELVAKVERRLGANGRLVLRYSGTEPLVRVMVEGQDAASIEGLAGELAAWLERRLGGDAAHA